MTASKHRRGSKRERVTTKHSRDSDYRRHRVMARSIAGRILVRDDGRMLVLGGEPDFAKLATWLRRLKTTPGVGNDVLGDDFPFLVEGELTEHALKVRGLALHRWRTGLLAEQKQRRATRRQAKTLNAELREVDALQTRLERLFDWQRRVRRNDLPAGHPFFIDADSTVALAERLRSLNPAFDDAVRWHACVVVWWSGGVAFDRFLEALSRFPGEPDQAEDLSQLKSLAARCVVFEKRSRTERNRQIRHELRSVLKELPAELRSTAKLKLRHEGKNLEQNCRLLKQRCDEEIAARIDIRYRQAPAILAALCVCDGSSVRLPGRLVRDVSTARTSAGCGSIAEGLAGQSAKPGYDLLLRHMDEIAPASMASVQRLLSEGETAEDLDWMARRELDDLNWHDGLKPCWARRFFEMLERRGVTFSDGDAYRLLSWIESADEFQLLREFSDWFERLPVEMFSPRQAAQARILIEELVVPVIGQYGYHEMLRQWMRRSRQQRVSAPGVPLKTELRRSLSGIAHFRTLAGERDPLPESWRRELTRPVRAASELAWLRTQAESGSASPHMRSRIQNLSLQTRLESIDQDKLLRKSQRAFLAAASESLRECIRRESIAAWEKVVGFVPEEVSEMFPLKFGQWVRLMNERQRSMLREILDEWQKHGDDYRRHLADNQRWLNKPSCPSLGLDEWLRPEPAWIEVSPGRRIRVEVSQKPMQTFLMGQHFGSCLSLHDCNRMSALTNAYDANKQVLYIYKEDGSLLGRQLVTISAKGTMLGYHCYLKVSSSDEKQRELLTTLVRDHCGRWAKRCGVGLGEEGEPETIAGHFWYDDGEIDWPDSAKEIASGYVSSLTLFRRFHSGVRV